MNKQERADDSILELFCDIDDFCQACQAVMVEDVSYKLTEVTGKAKKIRNRATGISLSEIMTILINFHQSAYRNFKKYYLKEIKYHGVREFPKAPSYNRFVELTPRALLPLMLYLVSLLGKCTGYSFVDSTKLEVCGIKREYSNKVFSDIAEKGKSSMGWFYGFKLHLICNDVGEILWFKLTPGNVDDRIALEHMFECDSLHMFGRLFADKGYISARLFKKFIEDYQIKLVTGLRRNMKSSLPVPQEDAVMLRKRSIIETINDQLKNISQILHTRHRSQTNFVINIICGLTAYCLQPKRPSLFRKRLEIELVA